MPLEIRELHIRVTVNQPQQAPSALAGGTDNKKSEDEKDAIITQCVEEVVEIINNKKER